VIVATVVNALAGYTKGREFVEQLSDFWLLKKKFASHRLRQSEM
jgi:hypothetical protein